MDNAGDAKPKCLWKPCLKKKSNVDEFRQRINSKFNLDLRDYQDLYKWSVDKYAEFWEELWYFSNIKYSDIYEEVIDKTKTIADIPEWFRGSRLNYAENILKHDNDSPAIYAAAEIMPRGGTTEYVRLAKDVEPVVDSRGGKRKSSTNGPTDRKQRKVRVAHKGYACTQNGFEGTSHIHMRTFKELNQDVRAYAAALRKMGIQKGDRVVGYLPNGIEAVEAMLAASSIGAIWSSTSPDFGVSGVLDRFSQIQPRIIFSVNAVVYNGKVHNHMDKLQKVVSGLPDLEKVVVIPYVVKEGEKVDLSNIKNGEYLEDFLSSGRNADGSLPELVFEQLPFNHPLFIMYSSGTTGAPKCMVHSAGGTLIKHLEEHLLQGNTKKSDIVMYYTTTGWMMWNWFVGALAVGAAIVCYDGSPLIPNANILWDIIDKIGITVLGTGAKWLQVLEERSIKPKQTHSLKSLHTILSTGSPLKPESFEYVYRDIKEDLLLGSITGGTDIIGCFAGQCSDLPVYKGEIQGRLLGMAMESWDEDGKPVTGVSGELVCTKPFPSMPTHFWRDADSIKYKKAYFNHFPGIWTHGDFCLISEETGGVWMLGRSDGTLNPSGVRFGSAEIYHVVESFKEIADALCVGQRSKDLTEERVILFLKMAPGSDFRDDLVKRVKSDIRQQLSARHVPSVIMETKDVPYTQNGKKVEVAVKKIISGEDVTQRGAYANPESLDLYKDLPELQGY